ncbi:MAG: acetyl-CoA carboxylase biotin carboxyl carrier protein subunit [Planctomycetota bacterium]|nr:acetyl-CoA carboxylase biotin carboxyl carrier protein subunit [Planctomycetota bacterium]
MSSVLAPMHCKVVGVSVKVGDKVEQDQTLFTIEAMKVEMPVPSPGPGTVTKIGVAIGQTIDSDHVMAELE